MTFRPLHNKVLIETVADPYEGKIALPDVRLEEKPSRGVVIGIGPGKRDKKGAIVPMSVRVGEMVSFNRFNVTELRHGGKPAILISEDDIVAVLEDEINVEA